jgi:hypothetical protein
MAEVEEEKSGTVLTTYLGMTTKTSPSKDRKSRAWIE